MRHICALFLPLNFTNLILLFDNVKYDSNIILQVHRKNVMANCNFFYFWCSESRVIRKNIIYSMKLTFRILSKNYTLLWMKYRFFWKQLSVMVALGFNSLNRKTISRKAFTHQHRDFLQIFTLKKGLANLKKNRYLIECNRHFFWKIKCSI